jgi:hypothetical protein
MRRSPAWLRSITRTAISEPELWGLRIRFSVDGLMPADRGCQRARAGPTAEPSLQRAVKTGVVLPRVLVGTETAHFDDRRCHRFKEIGDALCGRSIGAAN